jgi:hypothetical protein
MVWTKQTKRHPQQKKKKTVREAVTRPAPIRGLLDDQVDKMAANVENWQRQQSKDIRGRGPGDGKALAAFRLGFEPYFFRMRQRQFCETLDCEQLGVGMLYALDDLEVAAFTLLNMIHVNVYSHLPDTLESLRRFAEALLKKGLGVRDACYANWEKEHEALCENEDWDGLERLHHSSPTATIAIEGKALWQSLCLLTEQALSETSVWGCLQRLGSEVGKLLGAALEYGEQDPLPSLEALCQAVRNVPKECVRRCPSLRHIRKTVRPKGIDVHWRSIIDRRRQEAPDVRESMLLLASSWHRELELSLKGLELSLGHASARKPRWDKEKGKLYYDGEVVRSVRDEKVAQKVTAILDAFQKAGWRRSIGIPPNWENREALHQTIKSLNSELRKLRFHVKGKIVYWKAE